MRQPSRYVVQVFLFLTFLSLMCALFMGCNSTKKTQEQKDYEASVAHSKLLKEARDEYPCDTSTIIVTKIDTAIVFLSDTTYSKDTMIVIKTKLVTNTIYVTATVVDSAYGQLWLDRYNQAGYLLQIANDKADNIAAKNTVKDLQIESLKPWRTRAILTWVILGLSTVVLLYLKFKP